MTEEYPILDSRSDPEVETKVETEIKSGDSVTVERGEKGSGNFEDGWIVIRVGDERTTVVKDTPDGPKSKAVKNEELKRWQKNNK